MTHRIERSHDHTKSQSGDVFLEKIPAPLYGELINLFESDYRFINGRRMRIAEYFLGIRRSLADSFLRVIQGILNHSLLKNVSSTVVPDGFSGVNAHLLPFERKHGVSFAYFDAAITADGIKLIEFQGFSTYAVVCAKMSLFLREQLSLTHTLVFPNEPAAGWTDFCRLVRDIICGDAPDGIVLVDRNLSGQKTNFSFYAIQRELGMNLDIVDVQDVFEHQGKLMYRLQGTEEQVRRLYNRVIPTEAISEDRYPSNPTIWRFRFDQAYQDMVFVNHPCTYFELSKGLLPYLHDPVNPACYKLADVAEQFRSGMLPCSEFVWKDTWGYAGHANILLPTLDILERLKREQTLERYIAQHKIAFDVFRTGDGLEKIVELRFMTVQSDGRLLVVPMARIGHIYQNSDGEVSYHIHFGENNIPGYGLCPVVIFE
ncbi:hypothetical protein MHK_007080 [Candidatus Magnetomorum sp. HK-1]|nr:hypothetical protein MHK_007080 [Candidatus Magnetomorum sp. HK-1]